MTGGATAAEFAALRAELEKPASRGPAPARAKPPAEPAAKESASLRSQ